MTCRPPDGTPGHVVRWSNNLSWKKTLRIVWFANFTTAIGMMAMVPFLTYFVEELGITDPVTRNRWAGVLVGAAPVVAALMGPIWGAFGDRIGHKAMVVRALVSIVVFVGMMTFARSVWVMLVLRMLQGTFSGYVAPSQTLVSLLTPPQHQGYASGRLHSAIPAGAVAGYALGGWVSHTWEARLIFPICAALAFSGLLVVLFFVHDPSRPERAPGGLAIRGIVHDIVSDLSVVRRVPRLVRLLAVMVVVRGLMSTTDPVLARFVDQIGGDRQMAGMIMGTQALALLAFMPIWGRLVDRRSAEIVFVLCATGLGVSFLMQAVVASPLPFLGSRAITGLFLAGIFPAGYGLAAQEAPAASRGSAMGIVFLAMALSHAIGSAAGGELLNHLGFRQLFATIGVVVVTLGVVTLAIRRRRAGGAPRPAPRAGS